MTLTLDHDHGHAGPGGDGDGDDNNDDVMPMMTMMTHSCRTPAASNCSLAESKILIFGVDAGIIFISAAGRNRPFGCMDRLRVSTVSVTRAIQISILPWLGPPPSDRTAVRPGPSLGKIKICKNNERTKTGDKKAGDGTP